MITINGTDHDISSPQSITELLSSLGLGEKPVVIELNQEAISPSEFSDRTVKDGDQLEIIMIAAGG